MHLIFIKRNIPLPSYLELQSEFRANVKNVLLYGAETLYLNKKKMQKLQDFINKYLKIIWEILWSTRIINEEVCKITRKEKSEVTIKKRSRLTKQLDFNVARQRKEGRPIESVENRTGQGVK